MTAPHRRPAARERTSRPVLLAILLLVATVATVAPGARAADAPPPNRIETGFEERVRSENWDNSTDFNEDALDARHQWRFRTRAWAKLTLGGNTDVAVGLANESRKWTTPKLALTLDETVFETLYLEHRFADGASLRVGRQNISRGDGFILTDGSPLDGSRVAYFNAVVGSKVSGKSRLDLLIISDPSHDRYLPPIHDRHKQLIEWDETAMGLYWTGPHALQGRDRRPVRVRRRPRARATASSRTLGGRVARELAAPLVGEGRAGGQFPGQQPAPGTVRLGRPGLGDEVVRAARAKPSLLLGSPASRATTPPRPENEGWNPLFSRYPRWSELYIYTLASRARRGLLDQPRRCGRRSCKATPLARLDLRATYYRMGAFHRFPGKAAIYGDGTRRGDLYEARVDYKLNDSWRGHVVGEWMAPGDFYAHDDAGWFFRGEVIYGFKRAFGVFAL